MVLDTDQGDSIADQEEVDEAMPSSQGSLVPTEDSFCSMDIDLNALEKVFIFIIHLHINILTYLHRILK
jgi:hypothetical protein